MRAVITTRRSAHLRLLARAAFLACAVCILAAGCGTAQNAASRPRYDLQLSKLPGAGRVLADGNGFTLYVYVPDHAGRSRCYGLCAQQWPPLILPAGVQHVAAGRGVRAALIGTVRRADGARQVTYHGWPLYLWQDDLKPGQATGQGDDMGLWYVLSASGSVDKRPIPGSGA
jgi:predicted lipoprotein with Yx(FWY)xxD motif